MRCLISCCLLFCIDVFGQNFMATKGYKVFSLHIQGDTVCICEYHSNRFRSTLYKRNCFLKDTLQKPYLLNTSYYQVKENDKEYILRYRKDPKCGYKNVRFTKQVPQQSDKDIYMLEKSSIVYTLKDSLSVPDSALSRSLSDSFFLKSSDSISLAQFKAKINLITDSLILAINSSKNPAIDTLHRKIDSIAFMSQAQIEHLLQTADYKLYYTQRLLYNLSILRPQVLIDYVAKKPTNKKEILRAIRWNLRAEEICDHVRAVKASSKAKRQISRQYGLQKLTDVGIGAAYISIICVEIGLLVGLVSILT